MSLWSVSWEIVIKETHIPLALHQVPLRGARSQASNPIWTRVAEMDPRPRRLPLGRRSPQVFQIHPRHLDSLGKPRSIASLLAPANVQGHSQTCSSAGPITLDPSSGPHLDKRCGYQPTAESSDSATSKTTYRPKPMVRRRSRSSFKHGRRTDPVAHPTCEYSSVAARAGCLGDLVRRLLAVYQEIRGKYEGGAQGLLCQRAHLFELAWICESSARLACRDYV